jgi:uncharacterized repeat protein (TIGR01451 family)
VVAATLVAAITAAAPLEAGRFMLRGKVIRVVDGDTLDVRLSNGRAERVRLIGIVSPERGACYSAEAAARTRALARNKRVRLIGDQTQATRDGVGRRLAYVTLPSGADLGRLLLAGGFADLFTVNRRFVRLIAYATTVATAKQARRGMWGACAPPEPAQADYSLTLVDTPDPAVVGGGLTYTLTVANAGPSAAESLTVTNTLPAAGVVPVGATASRGSCAGFFSVVCAVGTLAPGASVTVTIAVRLLTAGTLTNTATVVSTMTADPNPANNTASATTTVE